MVILNMKKLCGFFFVTIIMLLSMCGCSAIGDKTDPAVLAENQYIDTVNQKLVSFSDCTNALSDSLAQVADITTVPTSSQMENIESCMKNLSAVCAQIQVMTPTEKYINAQTMLNDSMQKYTSAMDKCQELLNFYREYDTKIRSYNDPVKGGSELKQQAEQIYAEFADILQQATSEFHTAQAEFNDA
jgi:uncharacterized protein YceK